MDPYHELANAVVKLAADDYRRALKAIKRNPNSRHSMSAAMEYENFFKSRWFEVLTEIDGEWLMERLREEVHKE